MSRRTEGRLHWLSNRYIRHLLLILCVLEFRYKFRLVSYYVSTKSNRFLDGIGRSERVLEMSVHDAIGTIQREFIDEHCPGLEYEPLTEIAQCKTQALGRV